MSTPDADASAKKPKSKKKLLFIVVGLLVAGGAGGGWWWTRQQAVKAAAAEGAEAAEEAPAPVEGSLLKLDTFTVNLADPGNKSYLRVTVQLVLEGKETAADIEKDQLALTRIRSAVLERLTTQTSAALVSADGKTALKADITGHLGTSLGHKVIDVLFTDFVVQ